MFDLGIRESWGSTREGWLLGVGMDCHCRLHWNQDGELSWSQRCLEHEEVVAMAKHRGDELRALL